MMRSPGPAWVSVLLFMIFLGKEAGLFGAICLLLFLSQVCKPGWVGFSHAGCCPPKPGWSLWGQPHSDWCWALGPLHPPFATLR